MCRCGLSAFSAETPGFVQNLLNEERSCASGAPEQQSLLFVSLIWTCLPASAVQVPREGGWQWDGDWEVRNLGGEGDAGGWMYRQVSVYHMQ